MLVQALLVVLMVVCLAADTVHRYSTYDQFAGCGADIPSTSLSSLGTQVIAVLFMLLTCVLNMSLLGLTCVTKAMSSVSDSMMPGAPASVSYKY